jgi:hypothetical protein
MKIHSIRKGKRWRPEMSIQMAFWYRTKKYWQFNAYFKALEKCTGTQDIEIFYDYLISDEWEQTQIKRVFIDGNELSEKEIDTLAKNDGFDSVDDFFNWFDNDFEGQIVHWTDFRY